MYVQYEYRAVIVINKVGSCEITLTYIPPVPDGNMMPEEMLKHAVRLHKEGKWKDLLRL